MKTKILCGLAFLFMVAVLCFTGGENSVAGDLWKIMYHSKKDSLLRLNPPTGLDSNMIGFINDSAGLGHNTIAIKDKKKNYYLVALESTNVTFDTVFITSGGAIVGAGIFDLDSISGDTLYYSKGKIAGAYVDTFMVRFVAKGNNKFMGKDTLVHAVIDSILKGGANFYVDCDTAQFTNYVQADSFLGVHKGQVVGNVTGIADSAGGSVRLAGYAGTSYNQLGRADNETAVDTFDHVRINYIDGTSAETLHIENIRIYDDKIYTPQVRTNLITIGIDDDDNNIDIYNNICCNVNFDSTLYNSTRMIHWAKKANFNIKYERFDTFSVQCTTATITADLMRFVADSNMYLMADTTFCSTYVKADTGLMVVKGNMVGNVTGDVTIDTAFGGNVIFKPNTSNDTIKYSTANSLVSGYTVFHQFLVGNSSRGFKFSAPGARTYLGTSTADHDSLYLYNDAIICTTDENISLKTDTLKVSNFIDVPQALIDTVWLAGRRMFWNQTDSTFYIMGYKSDRSGDSALPLLDLTP